ncbi:MAG: hypothetical protein QOE11_3401 [Solirubrobacteraceae bacterium]|nr:hypothetical protein [Solirubrobacteraceae bacterium]
MFFIVGLVILGATFAATKSEGLQILAMAALIFVGLPALGRRFGGPDEYIEAARGRNMPLSVFALSLAFLFPFAVLVFLVLPDLGLGFWFWWWALTWPWGVNRNRKVRQDQEANSAPPACWCSAVQAEPRSGGG